MRSARPAAAARSRASAACSPESVSPVTRAPNSPAAWRAKPPQPQPISSTSVAGPRPSFSQMRRYLPPAPPRASRPGARRPRTSRSTSGRGTARRGRCRGRSGSAMLRRGAEQAVRPASSGRRRWNAVSARRAGCGARARRCGAGSRAAPTRSSAHQSPATYDSPTAEPPAGGEPAAEVLRRDRQLDSRRAGRRIAAARTEPSGSAHRDAPAGEARRARGGTPPGDPRRATGRARLRLAAPERRGAGGASPARPLARARTAACGGTAPSSSRASPPASG